MRLTKLSYIDTNWELADLDLGEANLIIAKNATGKSRTLMTIDLLVKMLTQRRNLNWGARWSLEFRTYKSERLIYDFSTSHKAGGVTSEKITIDGKSILFRAKGESAKIWNKVDNQFEIVYPPQEKLVLHANRDVRKFPFIEEIVSWAEQSYGFKFGNISPFDKFNDIEYDMLTSIEDIPALFQSLNETGASLVKKEINSIGFDISHLRVVDGAQSPIILVTEPNVTKPLAHYKLSQGMYRSLAVLIFLEYLISRKKPSTVIIDDLCEGLDYDRARKLGQVIFDKCKNTGVQLIVTSNDAFLMEIVDIQYWNILVRNGKKIRAINIKNSPGIFKKFRYTGLSNFDFFSSDFLTQQD